MTNGKWRQSRDVVERVFIQGTLTLESPTHFGRGDGDWTTDMPLLYDHDDEKTPLLTGASIAGALRNYLREYQKGFGWGEKPDEKEKSLAEMLFGHLSDWDPKKDNEKRKSTIQSWLMIDDALGTLPQKKDIEIRDGVAINPATRTAKVNEKGKGYKFDIELLPAGTTFDLSFEVWLPEKNRAELLTGLAIALEGLQNGAIGLGMRKRRGYGACKANNWRVQRYHYQKDAIEQVIGWLEHQPANDTAGKDDIFAALFSEEDPVKVDHQSTAFIMEAKFGLDSPLLIRSTTGGADTVDMVHLRSWRNGKFVPVVSGTSLAGVIRHRALRIANTLKQEDKAKDLIDGMFGKSDDKRPTGSRVLITEAEVKDVTTDLIQNRVKIDRFTGGAYPQALFGQQPAFPKPESHFCIKLELRQLVNTDEAQFHAEIGLLLLVLKDLWTGDLPIGGESSVGRGRLRGKEATLSLKAKKWILQETEPGRLTFSGTGKPDDLEDTYLAAFKNWGTTNDQ